MSEIILSKRLCMAATLVTKGNSVSDVGCDHAYVSIYLIQSGISNKCIAMDVRKGPLERAEKNIENAGLKSVIETRLSDGLEKLSPGETDTVLITGMGGPLICDILSRYPEKTRAAKELVLSPQSEPGTVRRWMIKNNFVSVSEDMCIDQGKYYLVIKAVPGNTDGMTYDESDDLYLSEYLKDKQSDVYYSYLNKEIQKRKEITEKVKMSGAAMTEDRLAELDKEIGRLQDEINNFRK